VCCFGRQLARLRAGKSIPSFGRVVLRRRAAARLGARWIGGEMPARDLGWRVEETCSNAFPSLKQVLAGDFLLRFAQGVSRRANSANPLRDEPGDIAPAIGVAER